MKWRNGLKPFWLRLILDFPINNIVANILLFIIKSFNFCLDNKNNTCYLNFKTIKEGYE